MKTLYQIRDYYRLKAEAEAILEESPVPPDGQPRGDRVSDLVASKVRRREKYLCILKVIEEARDVIPKEYRKGVWDSVHNRAVFPADASRSTYAKWKSRFVYQVAKKLDFL